MRKIISTIKFENTIDSQAAGRTDATGTTSGLVDSRFNLRLMNSMSLNNAKIYYRFSNSMYKLEKAIVFVGNTSFFLYFIYLDAHNL